MGRKLAASPRDAGTTSVIPVRTHTPRDWNSSPIPEGNTTPVNPKNYIKELPNEILLQISTHLCGRATLANLSRVNKQMHTVANEAIAKILVIRESHFKEAIAWLANHPDLMTSVRFVEIIDRGYVETAGFWSLYVTDYPPPNLLFSPHVETTLRALIHKQHDGKVTWKDTHANGRRIGFTAFPARYYTDLLFKICPNIKSAKAQLNGPKNFDWIDPDPLRVDASNLPTVNPKCELNTTFYDTALQVMQDSLESLTISQDRQWKGPIQRELLTSSVHVSNSRIGKPPITLRGFKKLRHLDVPIEVLGLPSSILFLQPGEYERIKEGTTSGQASLPGPSNKVLASSAKIIPLTLKTLQLRSCNGATFMLLERISRILPGTSNFEHVDIFFTTCAREFLHLCHQAEHEPLDCFEILSVLKAMGVAVSFYAGNNEKIVDMRRELEVMTVLSFEEVLMAAVIRRQFSEFSEHAIYRRRASRVEHRLFMKHAVAHFHLFNSSTFDADKWKQIALFHGKKYIKEKPKAGPKPKASLFEVPDRSQGIHCWRQRRPAGFFDLENFTFTFRKATSCSVSPPPVVELSGQEHTFI
jgi:hypothetical protein